LPLSRNFTAVTGGSTAHFSRTALPLTSAVLVAGFSNTRRHDHADVADQFNVAVNRAGWSSVGGG
jgi:hypothetical protein